MMKKIKPEKFLDIKELSVLENQSLAGGTSYSPEHVKDKEKKKKVEV